MKNGGYKHPCTKPAISLIFQGFFFNSIIVRKKKKNCPIYILHFNGHTQVLLYDFTHRLKINDFLFCPSSESLKPKVKKWAAISWNDYATRLPTAVATLFGRMFVAGFLLSLPCSILKVTHRCEKAMQRECIASFRKLLLLISTQLTTVLHTVICLLHLDNKSITAVVVSDRTFSLDFNWPTTPIRTLAALVFCSPPFWAICIYRITNIASFCGAQQIQNSGRGVSTDSETSLHGQLILSWSRRKAEAHIISHFLTFQPPYLIPISVNTHNGHLSVIPVIRSRTKLTSLHGHWLSTHCIIV